VNKDQIPFEPNSVRKSKKSPERSPTPSLKKMESKKPEAEKLKSSPLTDSAIPPEVNKRLIRRAALFSGIPTALGFITFIASYIIVVKKWADLPNSAVVLVSMGFLGIGVLGLSYGAISASWDENRVGHWWGWQEFKQNFGYLRSAWKSQRSEKISTQKPD
jgi:Photosynthesis affected mutant 68